MCVSVKAIESHSFGSWPLFSVLRSPKREAGDTVSLFEVTVRGDGAQEGLGGGG